MKCTYVLALVVMGILCGCKKEPVVPDAMNGEKGMAKGGPVIRRDIDVHILVGQSNMTGQGQTSLLPANLQGNIRNALIWNDVAGTLDTLRAGVNNGGGGCGGVAAASAFGPEISFAHRLCTQSRKTTVFLKRAWNASRMYDITPGSPNWWEAPDALGACNPQRTWSVGNPGSEYWALLTECAALNNHLIGIGRTPKYRSVLIYQGESDGPYVQRAQAWATNTTALITSLRTALNAPNLKAVIVRTTKNLAGYAYMDTVRTRQVIVGAQSNCRWVNADPWVNQGQMHANSDDLIAIGIAAADTLSNMP